jgi:diaminopimelate decarboxylase
MAEFPEFSYTDDVLHAEGVSVVDLAEQYGTPLFVYSHTALVGQLRRLRAAFGDADPLIAYSVKANPNLAVIRALHAEGAGADVVSGGELARALAAGVPADQIVFAGVGKQRDELETAVQAGILSFNVEVDRELELLSEVASAHGVKANIALRVNPDVETDTHEYIQTGRHVNKFGIPMEEARALYGRAATLPGIHVRGVSIHIGSQLLDLSPFGAALTRVRALVQDLAKDGIRLTHIDVGGGLGVRYRDEDPPSLEAYAKTILEHVGDLGARIVLEPGRVIAANAGILLTRVLYQKQMAGKRFLIVDQAMNDLARPSLYGAYHEVLPAKRSEARVRADIVGPVCESGDFLARDREVPDVQPGELLAAMSCGAYGRSMSSNYNTRPRAAEVLVRGSEAFLVHTRETVEQLLSGEVIPEFLK